MPDLETELERFGHWLDAEIASRVGADADADVRPLVGDVGRHAPARSGHGRVRLAAAVGSAAALAIGLLVVSRRADGPSNGPATAGGLATTGAPGTAAAPSSSAADPAAVTVDPTSVPTPDPATTTVAQAPGSDPRFVLPGRDLPAGYTISTTISGAPIGPGPLGSSVLYGRPGADGSWTSLLEVQVARFVPGRAEPDLPKQVDRACGCAHAVVGGRSVFVAGAISDVDHIGAIFDDVVLRDGVEFAWVGRAPPGGLEEIARASGPFPVTATAQIVRLPSPGGVVATVNGELTGDPLSTMLVQTASVPVDTLLAGYLPITSAGTLRREGSGWRYDADGEWVVLKVVSPGTVTAVRIDPLFDRAVADAMIDSLRVVDADTWASAGPRPNATYTVVSGDTLAGIAEKLGVPYQALLAANPELDPQKFLVVGQRLTSPGG